MGRWLARLKNENTAGNHATNATKPMEGGEKASFVGSVAPPLAPFQKIEGSESSIALQVENRKVPGTSTQEVPSQLAADTANDDEPEMDAGMPDPDRYCWPHSPAMNTREIDTFTARLARFTDKGLRLDDAERLADQLVIRDREGDDRRLCLECVHLQGYGPWRCGNWKHADVPPYGVARDLVLMLQRCDGFQKTNFGSHFSK